MAAAAAVASAGRPKCMIVKWKSRVWQTYLADFTCWRIRAFNLPQFKCCNLHRKTTTDHNLLLLCGPPLGSRITRYTPFFCLSVCPVPTVKSTTQKHTRTMFKLIGKVTQVRSNWPVYSDTTQLNSTRRRVELSWVEVCRYKRAFTQAAVKRFTIRDCQQHTYRFIVMWQP